MSSPTDPGPWSVEELNRIGVGHLPGRLGIEFTAVGEHWVESRLQLRDWHLAPNGYLHAATVIALADTSCGYGCRRHLPEGSEGFTTVELKANFVGTARRGSISCRAEIVHAGRSTQVWDAVVSEESSARRLALFRCTQLILWPKP